MSMKFRNFIEEILYLNFFPQFLEDRSTKEVLKISKANFKTTFIIHFKVIQQKHSRKPDLRNPNLTSNEIHLFNIVNPLVCNTQGNPGKVIMVVLLSSAELIPHERLLQLHIVFFSRVPVCQNETFSETFKIKFNSVYALVTSLSGELRQRKMRISKIVNFQNFNTGMVVL